MSSRMQWMHSYNFSRRDERSRISVMEEYVKGVNYYDALSWVVLWGWQLSPGHNASLLSQGEQFAVGISRDDGYTMYSCFVLTSK